MGVGGEASSHVAQSVVYVICWFHFCIGFPTNRILFCVGSKRVCRGWVGRSKTLYCRSKSLLEPAGRSRTLCRRSKSLLGPARSRMCAQNRSSDLFRSPHASNAVPRDRSRSRSPRGEGNDIVIARATFPQLFYKFSSTFLQRFYNLSTTFYKFSIKFI